VKTLVTYFYVNRVAYGYANFIPPNSYRKKGLCINKFLYYSRAPLYFNGA
jgi:hypothetical protein